VDLKMELKKLLVDALKLDDVTPEQIEDAAPLFGEGLGLDSIDALELGVALRKRFSLKIETVNDDLKRHFRNVRSLAAFVQAQQEG